MPSFSSDSDTELTTTGSDDTKTACISQLFMLPPQSVFRVREFLFWNDYQSLQNCWNFFIKERRSIRGKCAHFISSFVRSRVQVERNRTLRVWRWSQVGRL